MRQALEKCNRSIEWTFKNYDLAKQNCQDFVAKFIDVTNAYRREGEAYRGLHNLSSTKIPKVISNLTKTGNISFLFLNALIILFKSL